MFGSITRLLYLAYSSNPKINISDSRGEVVPIVEEKLFVFQVVRVSTHKMAYRRVCDVCLEP